ncbi:hypothetical protein OnM2_095032 [Erysiphe neolycopersici]|uniref:Retrotransposon gag domain-containing protein n=1 Tax=Erysiphe neolycopersici TaxID=212602 RepID=A0A420HBD9_9PEZI|nr:hypothetical protein OnM2_095032 [Erysiphe neolycopersici]
MSEDSILATSPAVTLSNEQFAQLIRGLAIPSGVDNSKDGSTRGWFRPQDLVLLQGSKLSVTASSRVGPFASNKVAMQLDHCLKGKAELWYTLKISSTTRAGLKASIENWCEELECRFRMSPGVALEKLERLKYTIGDVRRRKDPEEYLQAIVVLGRSAGTADSEYAQILTAHRHAI